MSLWDFLEKIQQKPRYVRLQILWVSVFVCMLIITSVWLYVLKQSVRSPSEIETAEQATEPLKLLQKEVPSLRDAFKATIGAFFGKDLTEQLEELEEYSPDSSREDLENQAELDSQPEPQPEIQPASLPLAD